jgi:tetratricopeptide (TPR) repeat protein
VLRGGSKYIDLPIPELYELADDPLEEHNLAPTRPRRLAEMRELLEPLRALDPGGAPSPESAEIRRRLASLGYLSGGAAAKQRYTVEDDPKRLIALEEILREVIGRYADGDLDGALRRCRELVRRRPGMRSALLHLAHLERESGNLENAIAALRQAFALNPEEPTALTLLATYLIQAGREEEAVAVTEPHTGLAEPDVEVLLTRGLALARLRRPEEALAVFRRARQVDPANAMVPVYLGTFYLMGGQRAEAREAYERALAMNPRVARAHSSLAIMAAEEGRIDEALAHWRRAVEADPQEHAKLFKVAAGLWRGGRASAARPLLELFVDSAPRRPYAREVEQARQLLAAPG